MRTTEHSTRNTNHPMRVTANTFPNSLLDQLNQLTVRQNRFQQQAATGQKVTLPEDDPVAMRRILDLQAEGKTVGQYQRNIGRHQELGTATYAVIKSLKKVSDRASELAVRADSLKSPEELRIMGKEVSELIKGAVQQANAKNRGDYLLAGTKSDQPPFVLTTDTDGNVTSVTYQGNASLAESEIAEGVTVTAQAAGANTTGSGPRGLITDNRFGADFFNHLIALQNNLNAGDTAAIAATDRAALAQDEENLLIHVGNNGAIQSRLEAARAIATTRGQTLEQLVSNEADADLAQTLVKLNQTQTAYQAALQSGARILNTSLLDYIR